MRAIKLQVKGLVGTIFMLTTFSCWAANSTLAIIPLQNRSAEEIQSLVRPLLDPQEHTIAHDSQLIIKASPAKIEEIKQLVQQLDTPIKRFQITVIQGNNLSSEMLNADASINLFIDPESSSRIYGASHLNFNQTQSQQNRNQIQTVTTLEGKSAIIKIGNITTTHQQDSYINRYGGITISRSNNLIETSTGFAVTPRMSGQQKVMLDISPWSDQVNNRGQITTQSAHTSLVTGLNKWIEVGGVDQQSNLSRNSILSSTQSNLSRKSKIFLKVEQLK